MNLDEFTEAYFECLCWVGFYYPTESSEGEPLDDSKASPLWSDLPERIQMQILSDCGSFQEMAGTLIEGEEDKAGHDFCLTRNGHGAGFWDGDWPSPDGMELTRMSKTFKSQTLVAWHGNSEDSYEYELQS